jgi:N-acetylglutamate synthase-like GNAT family acetyltransferase
MRPLTTATHPHASAQESFDPIMDLGSNTDLLPVMLYARRAGEWDYSNCLTLLLRHKGKPVVAAICRVFGPQMAELPLVATKQTARRQGHARVLVNCFEQLLKQSGVHTLVLPAAHETVETWKNGFAFRDMPEEEVRLAKQQLRILIFPGTEVLYKQYEEVPPPEGHHVLMPPPPKPSEQEAADCMEVAFITANM